MTITFIQDMRSLERDLEKACFFMQKIVRYSKENKTDL